MKIDQPSKAIIILGIIDVVVLIIAISSNINFKNNNNLDIKLDNNVLRNAMNSEKSKEMQDDLQNISNEKEESVEEPVIEDSIVYDGLTLKELSDKINRSLNSTLSGKGEIFATRSIELGLDPYLAVAIVLHETGCLWECSTLVKSCNNVGGQKIGDYNCAGTSYGGFYSLDDGINKYLNNLYNNYYALGLTTAETIGPKYAASSSWASKINYYIQYIKSR